MDRKSRLVAGGVLSLVLAGAGAGIAIATNPAGDTPLTGSAGERATAAALEHTRGGRVLETDVGEGGAAYAVEIRLDDGSRVEVSLDGNFEVIGEESDDEGAVDQDGRGND